MIVAALAQRHAKTRNDTGKLLQWPKAVLIVAADFPNRLEFWQAVI
ncbi:hypothetical protein [Primorskyibacter sedentarius]|nr:hypothetical protein [Primorskyibacter sedentarius]